MPNRTFAPKSEAPELRTVDKLLDTNQEGCLKKSHDLNHLT